MSKTERKASKISTTTRFKSSWGRKDKRWKKTQKTYQNLTEEEKEKKLQYHHEHKKNLSEEQREKPVEYRKNCYIKQNK